MPQVIDKINLRNEKTRKNEYALGYQTYLNLVETGDFLELLDQNTDSTIAFFKSIDKKKGELKLNKHQQ